jgi:hypothetical protein
MKMGGCRSEVIERHGIRGLLALLLVGVCLMLTSTARAGEWTQVTCTQPDGQPAPTEESWTATSVGGLAPDSSVNNSCSQQGGYLVAANSSQFPVDRSTGPMWQYTAPSGSTIAGGSITVSLNAPQGTAYVATPNNTYDGADVLVNCQFNEPCGSSGSYSGTVPIDHLGGTKLYAAAMCVGPGQPDTSTEGCAAGDGANGLNAQTIVYAADIELANDSTPTATGFAGSLLASAASGTADLTFSTQDPEGPGVYRVIVDLDSKPVYEGTPDTNGGRCASIGSDSSGVSEFLYAQPCKPTVSVDVPVDTTRFPNGQHQLKVAVQDAAGNMSVVYDGTVSIDNQSTASTTGSRTVVGPIGPGGPLALRGAANGTNASDQAKLTARWKSTSKATRTSRYGQADIVTGRLTTSTGQPISGALLDVSAIPTDQGAKSASLASVRTGPTGAWTLTLPKSVSSSTVRFGYRSHVNDAVPVATATLTLRVHAGIALRIVPRVTSVGHTIVFTGTLHGEPIPSGGKQLVLEASSGGEWIQFRTIATTAKGRYRASYRFRLPGPVTYRFRVYVPHEADFPFLAGTSNVVSVYER